MDFDQWQRDAEELVRERIVFLLRAETIRRMRMALDREGVLLDRGLYSTEGPWPREWDAVLWKFLES